MMWWCAKMLISDQSDPEVTIEAFVAAEKNHDRQTNVTISDILESIRINPDVVYTLDDQDGTRQYIIAHSDSLI
jgi:hypothetical protein